MARRLSPAGPRAKVMRVDARALPSVIEVEERYRDLLLLVWAGDRFLGRLWVAGVRRLPAEVIDHLIRGRFAARQWQALVAERLDNATGEEPSNPTVSVVVGTRNRTDKLRECLDALLRLDPAPDEILVVDNAPSDDSTRMLCAEYPIRYLLEPTPGAARAHNRGIAETSGELIAFTDDDCVPDPHWLRGLGKAFADPVVAAVTGYVAPLEIESRAQYLFEAQHGGFDRGAERRVFAGRQVSPVTAAMHAGATANVVIRREAFARHGVFSEDLGPGLPTCAADESELFFRLLAAGRRIVHEPDRLVWHCHRREMDALATLLEAYSIAVVAYCLRCLGRYREPRALGMLWWWAIHRLAGDLGRTLVRREDALPLRHALAQIRGALVAPLRLRQARRSRRTIPAIPPPQPSKPNPTIKVGAEPPLLSVVIPSHNRREQLVQILGALAAGTYPADRFEVVAALDRCSDGSRAAVETVPLPYRLTVVETDNGSAGPTRNAGVGATREATIVFLDDDIVPAPGFLAAHADAHRHGGDLVALGYCPPAVGDDWWAQELRNWWEDHYRGQREPNHQWTFVDFAVGNASLSRSLLDRCGGFDPTFPGPRGREDWELGVRILDGGGQLRFVPEAYGDHFLDAGFETALRNRRSEARSEIELARRHPQLIGHLSLVNVADAVARGDRRVLHAYQHPGSVERTSAVARRTLPALERLRMRNSWRFIAFALLRQAFLAGIVDTLPSDEALLELTNGWRSTLPALEFELGGPLPPAAPATAAAILHLTSHGRNVATLAPVEPGQQWKWEEVGDRVAAQAHLLQQAEVAEELEALAGLGSSS